MKKYILSIAILIVLILASAIFLPYLFKDEIIAAVKNETNENLNANLDFNNNIGINIFKSFPNLNLSFKDISLNHKDSIFQNKTILSAEELSVSFDLMEFYKNQRYIFKSIKAVKPFIHLEVNNDTTYNWDITKETDSSDQSSNALNFELTKVEIIDGGFEYLDAPAAMDVQFKNIDHSSSGNFNTERFKLASKTSIEELHVVLDNTAFLKKWALTQSGDIDVDLINSKYLFPSNQLNINGLETYMNGSIQLNEDDIFFDLLTKSSSPDLNKFLTLIPAIYSSDFEDMETSGSGNFAVSYKGIFSDNRMPAFDVKMEVENGSFKYPDMPIPAKNIDLDLHVYSTDGDIEKTEIDIPKLNFTVAEDPFKMVVNMKSVFANPLIDGKAKGIVNLDNISQLIPLENTELGGIVDVDIILKGRVEDISSSSIDKFNASGNAHIEQLHYKTPDMNERLDVQRASLMVNDQNLNIPLVDAKIGENDIKFSGKFTNFFGYLLSDQTLEGSAVLISKNFNANSFLTSSENLGEEVEMTLVEVPGNLDIKMTTTIDKLQYDDLILDDFGGHFTVQNKIVKVDGIETKMLGGNLIMAGSYAYDETKPTAHFDLEYTNIQLSEIFKRFEIVKAFAPIAQQVDALTTAKLKFSSLLNNDMTPKLSNVSMDGSINLENVKVSKLATLQSIDKKLGTNHFNVDNLKDFFLNFNIQDGKLLVSPFDMFIDSSRLSLSGALYWTAR